MNEAIEIINVSKQFGRDCGPILRFVAITCLPIVVGGVFRTAGYQRRLLRGEVLHFRGWGCELDDRRVRGVSDRAQVCRLQEQLRVAR
jgi:hypothetical protein